MTYTLKNQETYEKMGVTVFLYEHNKTKAQVVYVKSDDKNKTFGVGFKTPPTNSKGMAHIMEHSVLNGSKKYTTREPFMDMASSSLQTFLNAMTYPDKTVYPVSSENDKDFFNLTDVYLDAVFNPAILNKREILDQEGWHYEMEGDQIVGVSGVVYNEMKGALSDPDEIVYSDFISHLYKDSPYQYESGGDPREIYKLSYEEFLDFYHSHYHPSNAYIYFYGDLDIDYYLKYLDDEYLSKYEYRKIDLDIKVPSNSFDKIIEGTYPASSADDNSDYLVYGFLTKENPDTKYTLTLAILLSTLFNMDSSPIKNRINELIDPESFYARAGYGARGSVILQAQKASGSKINEFVKIIEEGLRDASLGINKESLKAAFSIFDYAQRDGLNSVSRGLNYFLMWSFDREIFESFKIVDYLNELRSLIDTDYYENFIKENFIDNPTKLVYLARPSTSYNADLQKELDTYIKDLNEKISKAELAKIKTNLKNLDIHQNKKDSEADKASIPVLSLADVPTNINKPDMNVIKDGFTYIHHNLDTAGLIYTSLYFDIGHLEIEELQYLTLINDLMGSVDSENLMYTEIDDVLFQYLSSPNFSNAFINKNDKQLTRLEKVSFTSTSHTFEKALDLMAEFMVNSKFDKQKRILEVLRMRKAYFESVMYDQGHILAMNRAHSHIDPSLYIKDALSGIGSYLFVKGAIDLAKNDYPSFETKIRDVYKKIFTKSLDVDITGSKEDFDLVRRLVGKKFKDLGNSFDQVSLQFDKKPYKEAILTDANVNYIGQSASVLDYGHGFEGGLVLATSILSNPYLYELIRAKGGAYGAGLLVNRSKLLASYSYRDPNILNTLKTFKSIGTLTNDIDLTDRDFENQQISTMGQFLRPKSPLAKANEEYIRYKKDNPIDIEKVLKEIKEAKLSDIKAYNKLFEDSFEKANVCVFGNRDKILKNKEYFDKIIDLND